MTSRRRSRKAPPWCAWARSCLARDVRTMPPMTAPADRAAGRRQHGSRAASAACCARGMRAELISVGEHLAAARAALSASSGSRATADNARAIDGASIVILAVKPQDAAAVLAPLAPLLRQRAAAVDLDVRRHARGGARGVDPARACRSCARCPTVPPSSAPASPGCMPRTTSPQHSARLAQAVMQAVGEVVWVASEDGPGCRHRRCPAAGRRTSSCWRS